MAAAGIVQRVPVLEQLRIPELDGEGEVQIDNLSFVDDLMTPLWHAEAETLLAMMAKLLEIVLASFGELHLAPPS
eukprot:278039-Amphidinium_carterae.1